MPNKVVSFTKGAPDIVIDRCSKIKVSGEVLDFNDEMKREVLEVNSNFSKDALSSISFGL